MQNLDDIHPLLQAAVKKKASDLHLVTGIKPSLRISSQMIPLDEYPVLQPQNVQDLAEQVAGETQWDILEQHGEVDFSYGVMNLGRFRCNLFRQRGTLALAMRVINSNIMGLETLGLPPILDELTEKPDGLILVTGPTGSGKSTTLASMIDIINRRRRGVIITLEDPIEYLHAHGRCIVSQREVGGDTNSFANGLRAALRSDPDVILVGEMRDLETMATAITAAETGHLVFSTLHTRSAAKTIDRIIDGFPSGQQQQIRIQLAAVLEAVISQQLMPSSNGGMVPAVEVMLGTPAIANMIREAKTHQIPSMIETGIRYGMTTLNHSLDALVQAGKIEPEQAQRWR